MITNSLQLPNQLYIRGVFVNKELFMELMKMSSLSPHRASDFWEEAMFDLHTGRAQGEVIQDIAYQMLKGALGSNFELFWADLTAVHNHTGDASRIPPAIRRIIHA